jgi:hypothetical protein
VVERTVHEYAIEPRAKVGALFEAVEMQISVEKTVLNDILRILLTAGDPKGEVVQISPMTLDERQEHVHIAVVHLTGSSLASTITGRLNLPCRLDADEKRAVNTGQPRAAVQGCSDLSGCPAALVPRREPHGQRQQDVEDASDDHNS